MSNEWQFRLFDPPSFKMPEREVRRVFIFNTGWDSMAFKGPALAEEIARWNIAEGFPGIIFHYVIDKAGYVTEGRPIEEVAPAMPGKNNGSTIAIAVQGLWHFTAQELETLQKLCQAIAEEYALENKKISFHGQCEVMKVPSPMFDYVQLLGLNAEGVLNQTSPAPAGEVANRASFYVPVVGSA